MKVEQISGATRRVRKRARSRGEDLPVRDIEIYTDLATEAAVQSAWKPTPEEIDMIVRGASIILTVAGSEHPAVALTVDEM